MHFCQSSNTNQKVGIDFLFPLKTSFFFLSFTCYIYFCSSTPRFTIRNAGTVCKQKQLEAVYKLYRDQAIVIKIY